MPIRRIRIRRNFRFKDIKTSPGRYAMQQVGTILAARTVARTRRGLDENNQSFAPYADGSSPVTLLDTGQMLRDYGPVEVTDKRVVLGFRTSRSEEIAVYHDRGTRRMPARPFLGVPRAWVQEARNILNRLWRVYADR